MELIVPERATVNDRRCYPLMVCETYVFPEQIRYERDVPFYCPPHERLIHPDGTVQIPSAEQGVRTQRMELLRVIDPLLAREYATFFGESFC